MLNYFKKISWYLIINFLFLIICLIAGKANANFFVISTVFVYIIFNAFMDEREIVTNQIILSIFYSVIYTFLWGARSYNVPMELKYVVYLLNIILILRICAKFKIYSSCLKDWIVISSFIFIAISIILYMFHNISFMNYIMSLQIYLRFLPAYIIISINNKYNRYDFYAFCLLNIITIFIEYIFYLKGKIIPDSISGVFGISNVQALLLVIVMIYSMLLISYIYKKISLAKFIAGTIATFVLAGVGEIKIFFIFIPLITIIIILINLKNILRFLKIVTPIIVLMIVGIRILINVSPFFSDFFDPNTIQENIYNYTMTSSNPNITLGRLENIVYTNNYILTRSDQKLYGLGIGSSMPDENWYLTTHNNNSQRTIFNLYSTELYEYYGAGFGYLFSSMNIIYLETGFIGFAIFYFVIVVQLFRSYKLYKGTKKFGYKYLAVAGISFLLVFIPLMFYYPYLLDIDTSLMFAILMALITNKYRQIKVR